MKIIETLVAHLQNLPGIGPRSARRIAMHLLTRSPETLVSLSEGFKTAYETILHCQICGNIDSESPCDICRNPKRNPSIIAIVETISDLWAIERSQSFEGHYHVLGGNLSAITGIGPEDLGLQRLQNRISRMNLENNTLELILATNLTLEGQTTAHYITKLFSTQSTNIMQISAKIKITRLAHGLPAGGELDYMDDGTIITALRARS